MGGEESEAACEATCEAGLLALGGEQVEEVVLGRRLLHAALLVFQSRRNNICSKSWVCS